MLRILKDMRHLWGIYEASMRHPHLYHALSTFRTLMYHSISVDH